MYKKGKINTKKCSLIESCTDAEVILAENVPISNKIKNDNIELNYNYYENLQSIKDKYLKFLLASSYDCIGSKS